MKIIFIFLAVFAFQNTGFAWQDLNSETEVRDIAILTFENKGTSDHDWITLGLEYLLNNKLSVFPGINIIDKNSTQMAFYQLSITNEDLPDKSSHQIEGLTKAPLIISGTYLKTVSQTSFEIIYRNAQTGQIIYREEISDINETIFSIADRILKRILKINDSSVRYSQNNLSLTTNSDAFKSFIKGYIESKKQNPDTELMISYFTEAISKDTRFWEAYYNLAIVHFNTQQYGPALTRFTKIINALPAFDKAYFSRALTYEKLKQVDLAINDLIKITEINPDDPKAYTNIARIYTLNGSYADAKINLDKARAINPDYAQAYFEYGNYYIAQNQILLSIQEYHRAVELNPENNTYRQILGETYYRNKAYYLAQYQFQTILENDPENAEANFMLGLTIYQQAVLEEIVDTFMDLLDLNPENNSVNNKTSRSAKTRDAAKQRKLFVEIIDAYTKATKYRPDFTQATFNLALVFMEQGNYKEAENHLKATLIIDPALIPAYNKLAEVYEKTNRRHLAIEQYKKIFYLDPSIFVEKPTLGPVHQYIDILNICIRDLDDKIKESPNDAKTNLVLAKLLKAQGSNGKAINILKNILEKNAQDQEAKKILEEIEKNIK